MFIDCIIIQAGEMAQHSRNGSQPSVISVPLDPTPSFGLSEHQAGMWDIHMQVKHPCFIILKNSIFFKSSVFLMTSQLV